MHQQLSELELLGFDFNRILQQHNLSIKPLELSILQANITYACNQACKHCHVEASPYRTEMMSQQTMEQCLKVIQEHPTFQTLDITGGAPELNPHFRYFVAQARKLDIHVIVRHNLTVFIDGNVLTGEPFTELYDFYAEMGVEIVSSLPHHSPYLTDLQRGKGAYEKSIRALKALNAIGFGVPQSGLLLNLVHNPAGAFIPGAQGSLEAEFKKKLKAQHGITFNNLFTITNMPLFRFREELKRRESLHTYVEKLVNAFNPYAAESVMCRNQISVGYDGKLYDCDFNQMLEQQIVTHEPCTIFNFDYFSLKNREIFLAPHCFGCTAGAGSSCGGATVK